MATLKHNNKIILKEMKYITNPLSLMKGLMFASKPKINKGACLVTKKDKKTPIHMLFCFHPYETIFVNSKFKVVDKTTLKPWTLLYFPKQKCKYIIESSKGSFKKIKVGDKVTISTA